MYPQDPTEQSEAIFPQMVLRLIPHFFDNFDKLYKFVCKVKSISKMAMCKNIKDTVSIVSLEYF